MLARCRMLRELARAQSRTGSKWTLLDKPQYDARLPLSILAKLSRMTGICQGALQTGRFGRFHHQDHLILRLFGFGLALAEAAHHLFGLALTTLLAICQSELVKRLRILRGGLHRVFEF